MAREEQPVLVRRSERVLHPHNCYVLALNYIMLTDYGEPSYYKEALQMADSEKWHLAMQSEMTTLHMGFSLVSRWQESFAL